jgi:cell division protein FtsX
MPPRRNPLALALLIGSLAMIGVGIWLFWTVVTASTFPNGYDKASQAFGLAQQQLTPALLIAGLLGIIGWFVLGALTSHRRGE